MNSGTHNTEAFEGEKDCKHDYVFTTVKAWGFANGEDVIACCKKCGKTKKVYMS